MNDVFKGKDLTLRSISEFGTRYCPYTSSLLAQAEVVEFVNKRYFVCPAGGTEKVGYCEIVTVADMQLIRLDADETDNGISCL